MVGVARVELHLPACQSLKEKRSIVKSVIARLRNKFNVSVAEVAYLEQWQRTELVIAAVANEISFLQRELTQVIQMVEMVPNAELIDHVTEYYE
ncbi:DUF503 domain-containing protein [Brevibacillus humidisoli]|uniref:DUF503 domain-containing protein n=1 Tax=Brevibacillus humidisoli TaxID=2895522 RepID=UPI001E6250EE|nr:DUF503 domain-containing protein [Brevibacillus humidisoli]UFJ42169.1 DUF503 domain-containing protein [Brevibacillus humidisoli]